MKKRYEGFLAPHGLYILDTHTGEVRFIAHDSKSEITSYASATNVNAGHGINVPQQTNKFSSLENEVVASYPYLIV